jgi:hypothetical protein
MEDIRTLEDWMARERKLVYDWVVTKGNTYRKIDIKVEVKRNWKGDIAIKLPGRLDWFIYDKGYTLQDIEKTLIEGVPYIKSVEFYEMIQNQIIL